MRGMADQLRSRGPDGEGFAIGTDMAIGMRRLAIIDLNGGWQPFESEDASVVVVANGEIYNYIELREELESRGHRFATGSDCETILHLYEEYGAECVHRLRGMFAFAVVDRSRRQLHLVRDRMGEKPLALVQHEGFLAFCSEMGGLIAGGVAPFNVDPSAIVDYYHWNFIPEPRTAIRGIRKLDAGCRLQVSLDSGDVTEDRYWSLADAPPIEAEPIAIVRQELQEIARIITRSEVPIGVGLSGGIDSSGIAALALQTSSQPVTGFTIGYEGNAWQDERVMAREFAQGIGLRHVELELRTADVAAEFGRTRSSTSAVPASSRSTDLPINMGCVCCLPARGVTNCSGATNGSGARYKPVIGRTLRFGVRLGCFLTCRSEPHQSALLVPSIGLRTAQASSRRSATGGEIAGRRLLSWSSGMNDVSTASLCLGCERWQEPRSWTASGSRPHASPGSSILATLTAR